MNNNNNNIDISVYVANLSKYVEGELVGAWLNLPASTSELTNFLKTKVGLNVRYEEYAVHDYESNFSFCEHVDLYELNLLAVKLAQMSEQEKTLAVVYCDTNGYKTPVEILNVCEQLDELSYVELEDFTASKEERLGYALVDNDDYLKSSLENCQLGSGGGVSAYTYFDFEAYGRDASINDGYFASDDIFIFSHSDNIDLDLYSLQELKDLYGDDGDNLSDEETNVSLAAVVEVPQ